jgi:hypothetical protein
MDIYIYRHGYELVILAYPVRQCILYLCTRRLREPWRTSTPESTLIWFVDFGCVYGFENQPGQKSNGLFFYLIHHQHCFFMALSVVNLCKSNNKPSPRSPLSTISMGGLYKLSPNASYLFMAVGCIRFICFIRYMS